MASSITSQDQPCTIQQSTAKTTKPNKEDENQLKNPNEIISDLPKNKGWWFEHLYHYKGFWLPKTPGLTGLLRIEQNLNNSITFQPSDLVLATSPKCGTTWLRALIFTTINRNYYDLGGNHNPLLSTIPRDLVPFLESETLFVDRNVSIPHLEKIGSPYFFSTHIPYDLFPDYVISSGCKFIYICRNPKDVFVSKYHFMNKLRPKDLPAVSLEEAFEMFCGGVSHFGPFWDHVLGYWNASLESPERVLFLKYEDLKREPVFYLKKLGEFLGQPFSETEQKDGVVEEIIKLCSFESLSSIEVNRGNDKVQQVTGKNDGLPPPNAYFRKGEVGDWKNHVTPQMADKLDQITKEKLHGSGLTF